MLTVLKLMFGFGIVVCGCYLLGSNPPLGSAILLLGGCILLAEIDKICRMEMSPEIKKVYVNEKLQTTLMCSKCGEKKSVDADSSYGDDNPFLARCRCGMNFLVMLEKDKRKDSRSPVYLVGEYMRLHLDEKAFAMVVEDISPHGLRFRACQESDLWIGDLLSVRIVPGDPGISDYCRDAIVRRLEGHHVGVEFCDDGVRASDALSPYAAGPADVSSWRIM